MKVAILVCTYGGREWADLARQHAYPSATGQSGDVTTVLHHAAGTLAESRNGGAAGMAALDADWLCFLDADDRLGDGYLDAMRAALDSRPREPALLLPSVQYVQGGVCQGDPAIPARGRLVYELNAAVIGTLVPRDLFLSVGGFRELPLYEDWDLWLRCLRAGAVPVAVPDAVYCADAAPGRNLPDKAAREATYWRIRREHEPHLQRMRMRWP